MNKRQTYYKGYGFSSGLQYDRDEKLFYKENTTKLPEKDPQYSHIDKKNFIRIIQKEVSKKVDKPFENIVILAGAGASVANNKGKVVSQLYNEINDILEKDSTFYSFKDLEQKKLIKSKDNKNNNLENILSLLIKATTIFEDMDIENINTDKLNKTVDTIKRAIYEDTSNYKFDSTRYKHNVLIKKLTNKLPNSSRLNVVTTNYDRLFEEAANELKFWVFDGFSFSNPPIFDSDIFDWQLVKNIPNSKTQELEYQSNIINLLKVHGSVDWIRDNEILIKKEISNNKEKDSNNSSDDNLYKKSVMIFPSSEKYAESYQEPYFSLMAKFQELLRKSNTLFITIGFSFADDHIFEMISQCIKHNNSLSVLITDCDLDKDKNKNWYELEELSKNYDIHFLRATLNTKDNQLPENMKGVLDTDLTDYL